jgi:hypothetical protein
MDGGGDSKFLKAPQPPSNARRRSVHQKHRSSRGGLANENL